MKVFLTTALAASLTALALAMAPGAEAAQAAGCHQYNGRWATRDGPMILRQYGNTITGDYNWNGPGHVTGMANGGTVKGQWADKSGSGTVILVMSPGGRGFTGVWNRISGPGAPGGDWDGACGDSPPPQRAPRLGPAN